MCWRGAIEFRRTHRFRHTRATSLLNAGVPLHVVQRYLGHLSPRMTMHYAQMPAATHEREHATERAEDAALKKQHHDEMTALNAALAAAHGELLDLRRQLGAREAR